MSTNLYYKTSAFYNKPSNATIPQLASQASINISGYNQEYDTGYWSDLASAGFPIEWLTWYNKIDNLWDKDGDAEDPNGTPCTGSTPQKNNVFLLPCDAQKMRDNLLAGDSGTWPLKYDSTGLNVVGVDGFVRLDTSVASLRTAYIARAQGLWDGFAVKPKIIFWDNGNDHARLGTTSSDVPTEQYPDTADWHIANLDWIDYFIDNFCIPNGVGLMVNYQTVGSDLTRFKAYVKVLKKLVRNDLPAGTMIEFFGMQQNSNYETTIPLFDRHIKKLQYAEGNGVFVTANCPLQGDLVTDESDPVINKKARVALSAWLLAFGSRSTIRFSKDGAPSGSYGYFSRPPLFTTYQGIRQPTGKLSNPSSGVYSRAFVDGGTVTLNLAAPNSPTNPAWAITPGVGSTNKPLVTFLSDIDEYVGGDTVSEQLFAEAQNGGVLSYSLVAGSLTGCSINATTGKITGTATAGTFTPTWRVSESGGGSVDIQHTWVIPAGPTPPGGARVIGLAYGSASNKTATAGTFYAAAVGSTLPAGFTMTVNGATDGTSGAGVTVDGSVPAEWDNTNLSQDYQNDTTNPGTVCGQTASTKNTSFRFGFNSGGTPSGRVVEIFINGVSKAVVDFNAIAGRSAGDTNVFFCIKGGALDNIAPSGGGFTWEIKRHASATVSSRVMCMDAYETYTAPTPPVLGAIGNKTVAENALLSFGTTSTPGGGTGGGGVPIMTADSTPDFGIASAYTDNGDGTGSFSWTPSYDSAGVYTVTFYATDPGTGLYDFETITITVNPTNRPPVLDPIGNKSVVEGTFTRFTVTATDPDGDTLSFALTNNPPWASITPAGVNTIYLDLAPVVTGTATAVRITVSDGALTDFEDFDITVTAAPPPVPQIQSLNPEGDITYRWHKR